MFVSWKGRGTASIKICKSEGLIHDSHGVLNSINYI